jgi:hypothetical protein
MKLRYSATIACTKAAKAAGRPYTAASTASTDSAQAVASLPKWACQNFGNSNGPVAMVSSRPMNGTSHQCDMAAPSSAGAARHCAI